MKLWEQYLLELPLGPSAIIQKKNFIERDFEDCLEKCNSMDNSIKKELCQKLCQVKHLKDMNEV